MIEFVQALMRSSGSWKRIGSSQGIREVAGEYVWIEGEWYLYLQDRRELLNNKDW